MRLTLRTLLAYRDGVLSPSDTHDLHQKIQKSHDAANLLKRFERITADIQGASPTIVGKGLEGDPNYLAEYLDDSLQSQNVPELERVCLVSDVRLAELVACHNILSSALHTRVTVPDALHDLAVAIGSPAERGPIKADLNQRKQQRLQSSPGQIVVAHKAHAPSDPDGLATSDSKQERTAHTERTVQVQAPMVASGGETIKQQGLNLEGSELSHEVPEYLVGRNSGAWRIPLAIVTLLVLLALLVWQSLGPWEQIQALLSAEPSTPQAKDAETSASSAAEDQQESNADIESSVKLDPSIGDDSQSDEPSSKIDQDDREVPPATTAQEKPSTEFGASADADSAAEVTDDEALPASSEASAESNAPRELAVPEDDTGKTAGENLPPGASVLRAGPDQNTSGFEPIVLASGDGGQINRIPAGSPIPEGTKVVIPPYFQPEIQLPTGVVWKAAGPSKLILEADHVASPICRALVSRTPNGRTFGFKGPGGSLKVDLLAADSAVALEAAYRPTRQGSLLEPSVMQSVLIVVAVEGSAQVAFPGSNNDPVALAIGDGVALVGKNPPERFKLQNIPDWYRNALIRPIDKVAAELLADSWQTPPEADGAKLVQISSAERPELAALAVQTMLLLDNWKPLFDTEFLSNPRQSIHWNRTISLGRQLLVSDPSRASDIQELFDQSSPDGSKQFQAFVGLTADEIASKGLSKLIAQMDSNKLASRVLAFYEIQNLTGKKLGFKPHVPNRASIQAWRRELATGRLSVMPVDDVILERLPR